MSIRSVAVFCGSKPGKNPLYVQHAKELGYILAEKDITVLYGGANIGVMGALADAVLQRKGRIVGVMPQVLMGWEHQHVGLTELHNVADMHARKAMLYEKCDAAIILTGGYGTLDEMFEMLTWNQLNIHNKKIVLLNTAGFYDHLIMHLKKMNEEELLYDDLAGRINIITSPGELKL